MDQFWRSEASSPSDSVPSSPPTTPDSRSEYGVDHSLNSEFILVIGGLGFIGSHTSLELLKAGKSVIIVDDLSNSYESVFTRIQTLAAKHYHGNRQKMPALHFHKLDYRSPSMEFLLESYSEWNTLTSVSLTPSTAQSKTSKIKGVIHFAAYKSVSDSIASPIAYYRNNVCGLVDLVELLGKHNIRNFVFSSSATVYGTKADLGRPLREEDLVHHPETYTDGEGSPVTAEPVVAGLQSPYARSKYFCEAILADIAHADPAWRIVALRYFNPIGCDASGLLGEDPKGTPTNLFPVITQVLTGAREQLDVFGTDWQTRDGTAVRDFVHVSDVARGHVSALASKHDDAFRTFNLGSGTGTTVIEAVRSLEAAAAQPIPVSWAGRRAGDVGSCVASNERAFKELGWTTKESIPQCARDLWNYVSKGRAHS
ncbi:UDP-glucose 4-epimerase 5 [Emericellopsis cladophorae]|uniref:UDP-glucose 4-epimerase 5 n=1 Tax=Emericellopsis cladophorae TaxID=2686198 RepID=A0A9P9XX69_9HYPO|nr:UDP-glucose 4-epimerase 5 [Emericellopsis cladophorae]KAI6779502.1 UDP-glucose 4-epimerase 5 [Emericellopsis cladophorae]